MLLPWRTVLDNILLQIEMRKPADAAVSRTRAALIEMAGLDGFENKYPWQLSGGMQQRASICRALRARPADAADGRAVRRARRDDARKDEPRAAAHLGARRGKTVLLITHSIPEAIFLSDRVLVMSERPGAIAAIYDVTCRGRARWT